MEYLTQYEIKLQVNKESYKTEYKKNFYKNTLPFNLLMIFVVLMVGILLIRSKEVVLYKFIIWFVIYVLVLIGIDHLNYKIEYKALLKYNESNKQTCTIFKDRIELQRCDSSNVRIFKFEDAHEITYKSDRERFRFLFSDGKVNVYKDDINSDVFEYLMKLCK